jgi:hypothetical protein
MNNRTQVTELGKAQRTSRQAPYLWMRLGDAEAIPALAFPARSTSKPLEAALPGPIELYQKLRADISRDVREKGELGTERFQLADLIESIGIEGKRTCQPELSLLEREIPEKAERGLPCQQTLLLLFARVDAKLEPLMAPHGINHTLVCKKRKRIPRSETSRSHDSLVRSVCAAPLGHSASPYLRVRCPESVRRGFLPVLNGPVSAQGAIR